VFLFTQKYMLKLGCLRNEKYSLTHVFTVFCQTQPSNKQIICFHLKNQNSVLPKVFYIYWRRREKKLSLFMATHVKAIVKHTQPRGNPIRKFILRKKRNYSRELIYVLLLPFQRS